MENFSRRVKRESLLFFSHTEGSFTEYEFSTRKWIEFKIRFFGSILFNNKVFIQFGIQMNSAVTLDLVGENIQIR